MRVSRCVVHVVMFYAGQVAQAVKGAGVFDESRLASIVAEYTGGICANYSLDHGTFVMTLSDTFNCHSCRRTLCGKCMAREGTCSMCGGIHCVECMRPCVTKGCKRRYCLPECAKHASLECCSDGASISVCQSCRMEALSSSVPWCAGCATLMCPTCVRRTCRCGMAWCGECFANQRDYECRHETDCVGSWRCKFTHSCAPRRAKGQRLAPDSYAARTTRKRKAQ